MRSEGKLLDLRFYKNEAVPSSTFCRFAFVQFFIKLGDFQKFCLLFFEQFKGFVFLGVVADFFGIFAVRGLDLYSEDPEENPMETNGKNAAIAQANKELRPMLPPASLNGNEVELIKTLNT